MQFPNWVRILWWVALLAGLTGFLFVRIEYVLKGQSVTLDTVVFIVWVALAFLPLVKEVSLFGFSLKAEIEQVEKKLSAQIDSLRVSMKNSITSNAQSSPQVNVTLAQSDAQIAEIEERVITAIQNEMRARGVTQPATATDFAITKTEQYLFSVRQHLEKEVRRIYQSRFQETRTSVTGMTREMTTREIISPQMADAIVEVYRACSAAVHGDAVTDTQVSFVRQAAPELIATLKALG